jgi:hypothetical protein
MMIANKNYAVKSGNVESIRRCRNELKVKIDECKEAYKQKVERWFNTDSKACWKGMKAITGYSKKQPDAFSGNEAEWSEKLNLFYARFEKPDQDPLIPEMHSDDDTGRLQLHEDEVRKVLLRTKINKAAGPDGITPRTLKIFANELTPVLTRLFNISLADGKVPTIWKTSIIVPVPKKPPPPQ